MPKVSDPRIGALIEATRSLEQGNFRPAVRIDEHDELHELAVALVELGNTLERRFRELHALSRLMQSMTGALVVDDVLDAVYTSFRGLIPYDRIGVAFLEKEGTVARARWCRSEAPVVKLGKDYTAPMAGSTLQRILETGEPRILNDLEEYLRQKPHSTSTQLIVEEGMRSSLTCPLVALGKPVGFLFFSSMQRDTYRDLHAELFQLIADELSMILEKARLYQELLELNELKDRFLGMAAHDLRNPLTVIRSQAKLLRDGGFGPLSENQRGVADRILRSCGVMVGLIDGLLDVRAIAGGAIPLRLEALDTAALLRRSHESNRELAEAKRIRLELELEEDLPRIRADETRLVQILNNLCDNAIKFSWPESRVTIRARREGSLVRISVIDRGQGIAPEDIPRLFTDFARAEARPTGDEPSTGLGLAIVRRLTEAQHGRVELISKLGEGSTFSVLLPVA